MNWKRLLIILMAVTVPVLIFINTFQAHRYEVFHQDIVSREKLQKDWVDRNKEILTAIEVLRAPSRLDFLATEELGLEKVESSKQIKVIFAVSRGGSSE